MFAVWSYIIALLSTSLRSKINPVICGTDAGKADTRAYPRHFAKVRVLFLHTSFGVIILLELKLLLVG